MAKLSSAGKKSGHKGLPCYLLEGYRVLDLTESGTLLCGKILADLGADVICVEPLGGNPSRRIGPFYRDIPHLEHSFFWMAYSAGKKSISLDITTNDGKEIFKKLITKADFLIESSAPGIMENLGFGYSEVKKLNPSIIYTSITPFGQTGPYLSLKTSELVTWASSGYLYMSGDNNQPPTWMTPGWAATLNGGAEGAAMAMVANIHRQDTSEGQHVDVSIQECLANMNMTAHPNWDFSKFITHRTGPKWDIGHAALDMRFKTKDGYVVVFILGGGSETTLNSSRGLVKLMAEEGAAPDWLINFDWVNEFNTAKLTIEKYKFVTAPIAAFFLTKTGEELFVEAIKRRILLAPVNGPRELVNHEQMKTRGFWVNIEHADLNDTLMYTGEFAKVNNAPLKSTSRAPFFGEHNYGIYVKELGLTTQEMGALAQSGVI